MKKTTKNIKRKTYILLRVNIYQAGDYRNTVKYHDSIKYSQWRVTEVLETSW